MAVRYIDFTNDQMRQMLAQQPMNMTMQAQAQTQPTVTTQTQAQPKGTLESILGGIGDSIANVGKSTVGLIGSGAAALADLATGNVAKTISKDELQKLYNETGAKGYLDLMNKAANDGRVHYTGNLGYDPNTGEVRGYELANEGKNQDAFKKMLYGTKDDGSTPNYAKAAGQALDAAATVSEFIPGAQGIVPKVLQGAASGFGKTYADTGGDLESSLKAAAAGGLAGGATGGLNKGLNGIIAKGGKLANFAVNHPLLNTTARGALSGAVGGGVGGGTMAALNGEDIASASIQGAGGGAMGGALAAPIMYGANKVASKTPILKGIQGGLNELEQDRQDKAQMKKELKNIEKALKEETNSKIIGSEEPQGLETDNELAYGESELANRTSKQSRGNMIKRLGEVMEGSQSNTTRTQNQKLGLKSAGDAVDRVYKKTGISDLDVQTELANELTGGANSYLDEIQRTALSATEDGSKRTVDTSEIVAKIEPLVEEQVSETNLSGNARQKFIDSLRRDVQKGDTITAANKLKRQAKILFNKKSDIQPVDMEKALVFSELADNLDDLSYSAVPKDNVDAMFETAISESRGRAAQAKEIGNKQIATAYEKIADNLEKLPRTIQAFRSFKKDFVDVSKMGELSALGEQAVLAQNGANITGNIKRFVNKALQKPTNQALAWAGSKVSDLGEKIASPTPAAPSQTTNAPVVTTTPVDRIGNFIGRAGGAGLASDMAAGGTPSTLEQQLASMNTQDATNAAQAGMVGNYYSGTDVYGNGANGMYGFPYSQDDGYLSRIEIGIQNAFNAGDFQSVEYLIDMYNTVSKMYQTTQQKTASDLTATQQQNLAKLESAGSALDQLEELYNKAGGGQGVAGNISNFFAGIGLNSDVSTYNQMAEGLINQIGAAVGKTDSLNTEGEVKRALSLVPKITDDAQTAKNKLAELRKMLETTKQSYYDVYGLSQY